MRTSSVLLLAAAASASAATISFSNTATAFGDVTYVNLALSQFDSSLGTLTGVTITVNELSIGGSIQLTSIGQDGTFNNFNTSVRLRQSPANTLGFSTLNYSATSDIEGTNVVTVTPGPGSTLSADVLTTISISEYIFLSNSSSEVASTFWGGYIGSGDILFQVRNDPTASVTANTSNFTGVPATSFADMTVTYTYTPVPEASTYGLILGGLALAGAAVRRRKQLAK